MLDVEVLDQLTGVGSSAPNLITPRRGHAVAVIGNTIYVIGGERFDPLTGRYVAGVLNVEAFVVP